MIKFYFNLIGYKEHTVIEQVKRIKVINSTKLQSGIDEFKRQINWDKMWSVEDAKERLENTPLGYPMAPIGFVREFLGGVRVYAR